MISFISCLTFSPNSPSNDTNICLVFLLEGYFFWLLFFLFILYLFINFYFPYLTFRLENSKTIKYVAGERYGLSEFMLLNIPFYGIINFDENESVDELVEKLDKLME